MKTNNNRTCNTKYCRKPAGPKRRKCWSCTKKAYVERHPLMYAYSTLKQNAKRRNKHFELTFEQFKAFAIATDYYKRKGRKATCYHIDRIDETRGYSIDNTQVLTNRENVKKYALFKAEYNHELQEMEFYTHVITEVFALEEVPF